MSVQKVFEINDIRNYIFNFVYPPVIKKGMIMQYCGSSIPKHYMFNYIGKIYIVHQIMLGKTYPYLNSSVIIFGKGLETTDNIFFPDNDDIIKIIQV